MAVVSGGGVLEVFGASDGEALSALAAAETRLVQGYEAVAAADAVSANVTGLLEQLNAAGALLSQAWLRYRQGDLDAAVNLAGQSHAALEGVQVDAEALTAQAAQANHRDFLVNIVGSGVGAVAVLGAGVAVWRLSKKGARAGDLAA